MRYFHILTICPFTDKYLKYGPVVKEHYFWNFPILHLYDKSDIETVLKWPSKFPIRPEMEALSTYRRSCPDRYSTIGIVSRYLF